MHAIQQNLFLALAYTCCIFLLCILFTHFLVKSQAGIQKALLKETARFQSIDGLRGLLALGVFVHHSVTAREYMETGTWDWSASSLLNHLGQTTVAMFFMITAFLFSSRLLANKSINWYALFVSRVMRLVPLHTVWVFLIVIIVAFQSGFELRESFLAVVTEVAHWLGFVLIKRPDINAFAETWTIVAGVNWSLRYEWVFYASLPVLYFLLKPLKSVVWSRIFYVSFFLLLVAGTLLNSALSGPALYLIHFLAGMMIAVLNKDAAILPMLHSRGFHIAGTLSLVALLLYPDARGWGPVLLSLIFFASIVGGNSIGGLLRRKSVLWLGEVSYGVYLLHGMLLYLVLYFMQSKGLLVAVDGISFALLSSLIACFVVVFSSLSYLKIEAPAIEKGKEIAAFRLKSPVSARWR